MTTKEQKLFRKELAPLAYTVLKGRMLAIDPGSNALGWALFEKGQLAESGVIHANNKNKPHRRILSIMEELSEVTPRAIDVLCIEKMFRFNPSLLWSVGAVITTKEPELFVEVPVRIWQALLGDDYEKSDERDAIAIGNAVIHHCEKL